MSAIHVVYQKYRIQKVIKPGLYHKFQNYIDNLRIIYIMFIQIFFM